MTAAKRRFLAVALGPAAALAAVWLMLAVTASASPPTPAAPAPASAPVVVVGPLTALTGHPAVPAAAAIPAASQIDLRKTVGVNPLTCGSDKILLEPAGTLMVYCYVTYNTGTITLTHHSATDSQLGTILNDKVFTLTPGSGVYFTASTTVNISVTNSAVWTAFNPGPTNLISDTDTARVIIVSAVRFLPLIFK
jgi:hypothetical protein